MSRPVLVLLLALLGPGVPVLAAPAATHPVVPGFERFFSADKADARGAAGEAEKTLPTSVPLGDLKAKYSLAGLSSFLADPLHVRPAGRMPRLLDAREAQGVANYLLQGVKFPLAGKGSANYAYYE